MAAIWGEISDSAGCGRSDAGDELVDRGVLEEVAAGARHDGVDDVRIVVRDREHDHPRQRGARRDLPDRVDAGGARHVQIHDDDVGCELADEAKRHVAVLGLARDLDLLLGEQILETRPEQVVVVDEQTRRSSACLAAGTWWVVETPLTTFPWVAYLNLRQSSRA